MLLVLDTYVILKWFLEEKHSCIVVKIREDFYKEIHEIVEPDLLLYEFTNFLRYNPIYTVEDVEKAINSLIEIDFDIVLPTVKILKDSANTAKKYDITVYDAVFISLAKLIGAIFVTADKKLYEKIKELKFVKLVTEFNLVFLFYLFELLCKAYKN
jgi:predicted nucleic acid-binding protein